MKGILDEREMDEITSLSFERMNGRREKGDRDSMVVIGLSVSRFYPLLSFFSSSSFCHFLSLLIFIDSALVHTKTDFVQPRFTFVFDSFSSLLMKCKYGKKKLQFFVLSAISSEFLTTVFFLYNDNDNY